MENNLNTQESSLLNQTVNEGSNQKVSILLKIVLALTWLLYIPFAFFIFAMSGMASDSGNISFTFGLIVFLVNIIPLVLMVVISFIALKKKSVFIALLPVLLVFSMQILISFSQL